MKATILLFFKNVLHWRNVGLLLGLIFINLPLLAQTVSQEKFPTYHSQSYNGSGTSVWINANSIYADDNQYTYNELKEATSNTLNTYQFGFSIPSGATIQGIKVSMGRFGTPGSAISDAIVRLFINGNYIGENKAETTETWNENEIETLKEYGGETDLWGATWTVEDINNGSLGFDIAVSSPNFGTNIRAFVDYVKITIYYIPLNPSYCAGASVVLIDSRNTLNAANSLSAPDGAVAKLVDKTSYILLDLTGEVTPRPQGGKVRVRLQDPNPDDGVAPWLYYQYATTRFETGFNWSAANYYQINSTTLVDAEIPVGENTRYLMLEVLAYFNLPIEIDAVTYDCPCSGATITSVTANPAEMCWNTPTTLSVTGDLCGADHWAWYEYGCGNSLIGTGQTIDITPFPGTRSFYVRAEGGTAGTGGTCSSVTVTVYEWHTASITGGEQNACVSTTLTATTNASSPVFAWYKDDVLMDGQTSQTLVVTQPGSYKVKISSPITGCERTSGAFPVNSVSTMPANRYVFADKSTVCPGTRVNIGINNSESGVYYRLRNDKDDSFIGDAVLGINGVNIYLLAGNLTETMTFNVIAMKGYCTLELADKPTVTVDIVQPSISSVTANPAEICLQGTTTLTVAGNLGCADHWAWYEYSCGGTPIGTGQILVVTPLPGPRTYYVRAEGGSIGTGGTCSSTTVNVNEWPMISITGGNMFACESTTLTAETNASSPTFVWYKDDALMEGASNSTLVTTQPGSYKVKVTNGTTGCERLSNAFTVLSVSQMPLSRSVSADKTQVCSGSFANILISSAQSGVLYQLRNDDGDVNIGSPILGIGYGLYLPTGTLNTTTTFNVLAISGDCSLEMADKPTVTVLSGEPAITGVAAVPAVICQGTSSTLSVTGSLGSATAWKWYSGSCGGTLVGTGASITVSPTEATTYYVRGEGGCATSGAACSEITVTINPSITPSVTIASSDADNKICFGTEVTFTATPHNTGDGTVTYVWIYNGIRYEVWDKNTMMTTELEDGEKVSCEITVSGSTCLTSSTVTSNEITTNVYDRYAVPSVTIVSSDEDNMICDNNTPVTFTAFPVNTSGGNVSYVWNHNNSVIGINQNSYTSSELEDGDFVSCQIIVTGAACFDEATAASNEIITNVIPKVVATITSDDDDNIILTGTSVTFTATPLNYMDGTVHYFWVINEEIVAYDQDTYTTSSLKDGDQVMCGTTVTGGTCPTIDPTASNVITIRVNQCTPGQDDNFEPNNTLASAASIVVDAPDISANILNAKDLDWFKFSTTLDGYYTINFSSNGGKETVDLCNAKGQKLRPGSKTSLVYNLSANTTYYIKVYDSKLKSPSPCYSMNVSYSAVVLAGDFIEQNMDLKIAEIEPTATQIIKIWPNPTKNEFELYNGNEIQIQVRIMDAIGRTIETIESVGMGQTVLFGSNYTPGMYFVETIGKDFHNTFKVVKR